MDNYRIQKYDKGFLIEKRVNKTNLLGFPYYKWECVSFYIGTTEPFYYHSFQSALEIFLIDLKHDILYNSKI